MTIFYLNISPHILSFLSNVVVFFQDFLDILGLRFQDLPEVRLLVVNFCDVDRRNIFLIDGLSA